MNAYITSLGVLIVSSCNLTELFALKNINKILLIEQKYGF